MKIEELQRSALIHEKQLKGDRLVRCVSLGISVAMVLILLSTLALYFWVQKDSVGYLQEVSAEVQSQEERVTALEMTIEEAPPPDD